MSTNAVALLQHFKLGWLGFVLIFWTATLANAAFDSFEVSDGYSSKPDSSLIGLPTRSSDIFSGPWQDNSDAASFKSDFLSSNSQMYQGYRSFEINRGKQDQGLFVEAVRPIATYNGGLANPMQQVSVYAFIPSDYGHDPNSSVGIYLYSGSFAGNESASITGRRSTSNPAGNSWWVWDAGRYVDTGVPVRPDTWVQLTMDVNLATKTYTVTVDGLTPTDQSFGFGANSSANLTGVAFGMNNSAWAQRSVYFDALTVGRRVPEFQSWLTMLGMVGAGLLPFSLRTRR